MKQTATNYLIDQLSLKAMAEHMPWVAEILDKAREMEQEQIIQAYENLNYDDGKEYYNETYEIENRDTQ